MEKKCALGMQFSRRPISISVKSVSANINMLDDSSQTKHHTIFIISMSSLQNSPTTSRSGSVCNHVDPLKYTRVTGYVFLCVHFTNPCTLIANTLPGNKSYCHVKCTASQIKKKKIANVLGARMCSQLMFSGNSYNRAIERE